MAGSGSGGCERHRGFNNPGFFRVEIFLGRERCSAARRLAVPTSRPPPTSSRCQALRPPFFLGLSLGTPLSLCPCPCPLFQLLFFFSFFFYFLFSFSLSSKKFPNRIKFYMVYAFKCVNRQMGISGVSLMLVHALVRFCAAAFPRFSSLFLSSASLLLFAFCSLSLSYLAVSASSCSCCRCAPALSLSQEGSARKQGQLFLLPPAASAAAAAAAAASFDRRCI